MPSSRPLVSVVMTAYRHARFVQASIESVLRQSLRDIELIVVDDGSDDGTDGILKRILDPRLTFHVQRNAGPGAAMNRAIADARGEFVAIMSADDLCCPRRLEEQIESLNSRGLDGVFGRPVLIDEDGCHLPDSAYPQFFAHRAESSVEIIRTIFFSGSFLCAPSGLVRASALRGARLFHPALYQLQDCELWIRLAGRAALALTDQRVVMYRMRKPGLSLSNSHAERIAFERHWIYERFFASLPPAFVLRAFAPELRLWWPETESGELSERVSMIYLRHADPEIRRLGLSRLLDRFSHDHQQATIAGVALSGKELAELFEAAA